MVMIRRALLTATMAMAATSAAHAQETLASSLEGNLDAPARWSSFGRSLAVDGLGDVIVVGDPEALGARVSPVVGDGSLGGSVHVFERSGDGWHRLAQIWTPRSDALFGSAVAISSGAERLVIGAPGYWGDGFVEIYVRDGDGWTLEATLDVEGEHNQLGASVAISAGGDRVLVGAPTFGGGGAGFVFSRTPDGWAREAMFGPPEPDFRGERSSVARSH